MKSHYVHDEKHYAVPTNGNVMNNAGFLLHFIADFSHLHGKKQKRGKSVNDSYHDVEFSKDLNEKFVVKATKKILPRIGLMLDWSKSEIKLINNENYFDNKPGSRTKKPKTTKSKSKEKKHTSPTRRSGRKSKSNAKLTALPMHDLINKDNVI